MQDLGVLADGHDSVAINNLSQVVGDVGFVIGGSYQYRAFIWTEKEEMRELSPPDGNSYYAHGINDRGQVIGHINPNTATYTNSVPFLWTETDGIQDLNDLVESLPEGGRLTGAAAINASGQIVGTWLSKEGLLRGYLLTPQRAGIFTRGGRNISEPPTQPRNREYGITIGLQNWPR